MKLKKRYIVVPLIFLVSILIFFNLYSFLAPNKPVADAKILVIDAWLSDDEMTEAVEVFKKGNYTRALVPGGELERSLFFPGMKGAGDVSAIVLMYKGLPHDKITPLFVEAVKKDRTYQSALTVQAWMKRKKINSNVNLFTSSVHARRSWLLYKKAFKKDIAVGIIASKPTKYDAKDWWKTSNGFRTVLSEAIAYIYAFLFFHSDI